MLTQNHPAISSAIRVDNASLGFGIYLGDEYMGLVEQYPVWGLDAGYDAAIAQGLAPSDECYVANNFPYRYFQSAIGAITGAYLKQASTDTPRLYIYSLYQPFPRLGGYGYPPLRTSSNHLRLTTSNRMP
jgi:hypothetical protein